MEDKNAIEQSEISGDLEKATREFEIMLEKAGLSKESTLSMVISFGCGYSAAINNNTNVVKEIKVAKLLDEMLKIDKELYEKILDTTGFAYCMNELIKLAKK
jgi:hypothetical protein